jgi:hypothetical protein
LKDDIVAMFFRREGNLGVTAMMNAVVDFVVEMTLDGTTGYEDDFRDDAQFYTELG